MPVVKKVPRYFEKHLVAYKQCLCTLLFPIECFIIYDKSEVMWRHLRKSIILLLVVLVLWQYCGIV